MSERSCRECGVTGERVGDEWHTIHAARCSHTVIQPNDPEAPRRRPGRPRLPQGEGSADITLTAPVALLEQVRQWPRGMASRLAQEAWAAELACAGMSERERLTAELERIGVRLGECLRREREEREG